MNAQIPPQRILIIEDDPVMQLGLEQFFEESSQYQIVGIAADGYLGVDIAMKLQPDLVIMDIGLPRLDGIAATQQIKTNLANVRVVILTDEVAQCKSPVQYQWIDRHLDIG